MLIARNAHHGQGIEESEMQLEGHIPNAVTFSNALKACADIGAIDKGKETHEEIDTLWLLCWEMLWWICMPSVEHLQKHGKCLMNFLCEMWSPELH